MCAACAGSITGVGGCWQLPWLWLKAYSKKNPLHSRDSRQAVEIHLYINIPYIYVYIYVYTYSGACNIYSPYINI